MAPHHSSFSNSLTRALATLCLLSAVVISAFSEGVSSSLLAICSALSAAIVVGVGFIGRQPPTTFAGEKAGTSGDVPPAGMSSLGYGLHNVMNSELLRSEERYRSFIRLSSEGIWRAELTSPIPTSLPVAEQVKAIFETGYLAECNDAMAKQYGYDSAEQLVGVRICEVLVPDDPKNHEFLSAFVMSDYQLSDAESHEVDANGNAVYFSNSLTGVVENGCLVRGWGTQRDITGFKRQAEEISHLSERLKGIVENSEDAILSKTLDGTIQTWNAGAERIFGYSAEEAIGQSIFVLVPPNRHDEERATLDAVAKGVRVEHRETRRIKKDGTEITISESISPVMSRDGNIVGASKIARDVSEQIRHQEILVESEARYRTLAQERNDLLEKERGVRASMELANRLKEEFLLTLSHELRTPLNAILGWAQLISRQAFNAERLKEGLAVIERNARTQAKMIDDLLDMNRIISGKIRLNVGKLDLSALVRASVESIKATAGAKNITLECTTESGLDLVMGDAARLSQALWNLLTNAVKYTPQGGLVKIDLARVGDEVKLRVIDSGEGIAPEFLPLVFDRFRQADASITRKHGGLGLGLNIVRQLVELHAGYVEAFSEGLGKGSTFTLTIPITQPAATTAEREEHRAARTSVDPGRPHIAQDSALAGRIILVVDDEKDARDLLKVILEEHGARVATVGSVSEAMSYLMKDKVDLVVSDIGMPEEDGYQLMRKLRALPPDRGGRVPAIAVTAFTRHEDRLKSIDAGFKFHVAKPVNPSELVSFIGKATANGVTAHN